MKKLTVAISAVAASVLMAMSAQAAEIYNKDSNKLDLYGKVNAKHYFSSNDADDGDTTYARLGFKGETQINDQLTGFGQWEYEFKGNRAESQGSSKDKTRLAFAGLKFGDYGSIDYGRNYGVACMDRRSARIRWRYLDPNRCIHDWSHHRCCNLS